jgi:ribokinase/sulfofructose kinase
MNPTFPLHKAFDVVALGGLNVDLVLQAARPYAAGEKVKAKFMGRFPGGPVGNFACAASRLGCQVAAWAVVGADEDGDALAQSFAAYGVDTSHLLRRADRPTPFTVIRIDPTGEREILVPEFEDRVPLDTALAVLPFTKMLYLMPQDVAYFLEVAQLARQFGVRVMVDIEATLGLQRADLVRMAPLIDILSFNESGYQEVWGRSVQVEDLNALCRLGPRMVVVTRGKRGVVAVDAATTAEVAGFQVAVADTTGAGDTFNAAFLSAVLAGRPLAASLQFGCAAAALVIGSVGARTHLPTRTEVEAFLLQA